MNHKITDLPTPRFGEVLRNQVEERLTFFESGAPPSKNADAMKKAFDQLKLDEQANMDVNVEKAEKKKKKRKSDAMDVDENAEPVKKKRTKEEKEARKLEKKTKKLVDDGVSECSLQFVCLRLSN